MSKIEPLLLIYGNGIKSNTMLSTIFLFVLFLSAMIASTQAYRVHVSGGRARGRRRRSAANIAVALKKQASYLDHKNHCAYANHVFPVFPETSPALPPKDFRYIYDHDPVVDLWEFQKRHCIPPPPLTTMEVILNTLKVGIAGAFVWFIFMT